MIAEATKCIRCNHSDAIAGGECKTCGHISTVLSCIHRRWRREELAGLAETLRGETLASFNTRCATNGLTGSHLLGTLIERLAYPAGLAPDVFKMRIVDALGKYLGEMEGVDKWEAAHGDRGGYMRRWIAAVESWTGGNKP